MSKKTNVRSFRYSDEVAAILEGMKGQSANDNFEQLVLDCYYKLPELQEKQKQVQNEIDHLRQQLRTMLRDLDPAICNMTILTKDITQRYDELLKTFDRVTQAVAPSIVQAPGNV